MLQLTEQRLFKVKVGKREAQRGIGNVVHPEILLLEWRRWNGYNTFATFSICANNFETVVSFRLCEIWEHIDWSALAQQRWRKNTTQ